MRPQQADWQSKTLGCNKTTRRRDVGGIEAARNFGSAQRAGFHSDGCGGGGPHTYRRDFGRDMATRAASQGRRPVVRTGLWKVPK